MSVKIYTGDFCSYCDKAKSFLRDKGVIFEEIDAPKYSSERQEMEQLSGRTSIPQIFISGKHIGGYDDLIALHKSGDLDALLKN